MVVNSGSCLNFAGASRVLRLSADIACLNPAETGQGRVLVEADCFRGGMGELG